MRILGVFLRLSQPHRLLQSYCRHSLSELVLHLVVALFADGPECALTEVLPVLSVSSQYVRAPRVTLCLAGAS